MATVALLSTGLLPRLARGVPAVVAGEKGVVQPNPRPLQNLGSWAAPVSLSVSAIHAALLTSGQVLLWYSDVPFGSGTNSHANLWNPATNAVTSNNLTENYDIFCSGTSYLPNGQLFITGGRDDSKPHADAGIPQTFLYDPTTNGWTQGPTMSYYRWYPTNLELGDGTTLIASGKDDNGDIVYEMEEYNYETNTLTVLPASADMSTANTYIYPRMVLMPSGKVFMGGMYAQSMVFTPATNSWVNGPTLNFGQRIYGAMVLLPGLQKVMQVGGDPDESQAGNATNTVEEIDFSKPTPVWSYVASMNEPRQNENLVLLPDGTVLAVGGGTGGGRYTNPVYEPEDYNPTANTWTLYSPQEAQRTYHSTALLLPDGRVLSAGSDSGPMARTLEVFSPPYLSNGTRPTITSAPTSVTYNQKFVITTPDAATITRVALIKVASTTHATRFDERFVDLTFKIGSGRISATAPSSGNYAPPGYYMLDILNSSGVPAVMPFVLVN
ncbi:MAG TPA: galactose oxidase-like domain-containing protein [Terriglobia bacterium]